TGQAQTSQRLLTILEEARQKYRFVVHGYVIMPEHFHLLMTEPEVGDPSAVMKVLKERFTRKLRTEGAPLIAEGAPLIASFAMSGLSRPEPAPVWQKRFYDFNVWTENKHVEKLRYMHRNPVKRGLVDRPEHWEWSSFRSYLFGETGPVRVRFQEWPLDIFRTCRRALWKAVYSLDGFGLHFTPGAPHIRVLCECVGVGAAPLLSVAGGPVQAPLGRAR